MRPDTLHRQSHESSPRPLVVLADLERDTLFGLTPEAQARQWAVIANCRAALNHARAAGLSIALLRRALERDDSGTPHGSTLRQVWISGLEPQRRDLVFARTAPSCYSNPYFAEIVEANGGRFVIAGLLSFDDWTATARDAAGHGHAVSLLSDAALVSRTAIRIPRPARPIVRFPVVQVLTTKAWMSRVARLEAETHGQ